MRLAGYLKRNIYTQFCLSNIRLMLLLITKILCTAAFLGTYSASNIDNILLSFTKLSLEAKILREKKKFPLHVVKRLHYNYWVILHFLYFYRLDTLQPFSIPHRKLSLSIFYRVRQKYLPHFEGLQKSNETRYTKNSFIYKKRI